MNMVRSVKFRSDLPSSFLGGAAEYASHILNRISTRGNALPVLPLQVPTGVIPTLTDIVFQSFQEYEDP